MLGYSEISWPNREQRAVQLPPADSFGVEVEDFPKQFWSCAATLGFSAERWPVALLVPHTSAVYLARPLLQPHALFRL